MRLKVTVRVTTCRTLTGLDPALRGDSPYRDFQSEVEAENGERRLVALLGEAESKAGDVRAW